ncbi:MAG: hypothetical protein AAF368_01665, partial [Planctomycetota bacterium]
MERDAKLESVDGAKSARTGGLWSWFSFSEPVTRMRYVRAGLLLMALKYGVDALVHYLVLGGLWNPLDYLNPLYAQRMSNAPLPEAIPPLYLVFVLLWGLFFAWIGTNWSARRAVDAGLSPWWGLLFIVPFMNYLTIFMFSLIPTWDRVTETDPGFLPHEGKGEGMRTIVLAGLTFLAAGAFLFVFMVHGAGNYGMAVFFAFPLLFGVGLGFAANRKTPRGLRYTLWFVQMAILVACLGLFFFAMEGLICILMASPILLAAVSLGALLGRGFAKMDGQPREAGLPILLLLPLSAWVDSSVPKTPAREVVSVIEVDAPPGEVWKNVVSFSELPEPDSWLFRTGIAFPLRARIEGEGVGAVRHCEFSTGAFVEPITVWDEPRRLSFDVIAQPVPMEEWSFYEDVHPPHLENNFRSVRGEFRLTA